MDEKLLNGWKEIGSYLGRTVRTAQRWEAQFEMPVHRPATRKRTPVVAFPRELDNWLARSRSRLDAFEKSDNTLEAADLSVLSQKLALLQMETAQLALEIRRASQDSPRLLNRTESMPGLPTRPD